MCEILNEELPEVGIGDNIVQNPDTTQVPDTMPEPQPMPEPVPAPDKEDEPGRPGPLIGPSGF